MEKENKKAMLEAVLFAVGDSVELKKLSEIIEEDEKTTKELLYEMKAKYDKKGSGLVLLELEKSFQLACKQEFYDVLSKIVKVPGKMILTDSTIETLSIIAYKQPVTRLEVETIRGVNCDHSINKLLEYELIEELGRKDAPGRPILFGTTEQFLKTFGVKSLGELPDMDTLQIEEFRKQAEEEVQLTLKI